MTDQRLPAKRSESALAFDPNTPKPHISRGLSRLESRARAEVASRQREEEPPVWTLTLPSIEGIFIAGISGDLLIARGWEIEGKSRADFGIETATGAVRW